MTTTNAVTNPAHLLANYPLDQQHYLAQLWARYSGQRGTEKQVAKILRTTPMLPALLARRGLWILNAEATAALAKTGGNAKEALRQTEGILSDAFFPAHPLRLDTYTENRYLQACSQLKALARAQRDLPCS